MRILCTKFFFLCGAIVLISPYAFASNIDTASCQVEATAAAQRDGKEQYAELSITHVSDQSSVLCRILAHNTLNSFSLEVRSLKRFRAEVHTASAMGPSGVVPFYSWENIEILEPQGVHLPVGFSFTTSPGK